MLNSLDLEGAPQDTRVVVAMSGGVDSSVTAALLKAEGYDVVGVTLQLYDHGAATHRKGACCAGQDIHDARRVAERDRHSALRARLREPLQGGGDRPLSPRAMRRARRRCRASSATSRSSSTTCSTTARDLGAEVLATGHYVASRRLADGARALFRAREEERDQSYFLFATTREQLDFLRFPLGDRPKAEVRELARGFGLAVADKHDSQDICFVPTGRYTDVIERLMPGAAEPGDIVDLSGRVLGRHDGIIHFTVGQRRGLGIAAGEPLYVVRLDAERRRVVVGPREALRTMRMRLRDVNWLGDGDDRGRARRQAARGVRQGALDPAAAAGLARPWRATASRSSCSTARKGVAPGQACVFYDAADGQARVLGGGFIQSVAARTRHGAAARGRSASAAAARG